MKNFNKHPGIEILSLNLFWWKNYVLRLNYYQDDVKQFKREVILISGCVRTVKGEKCVDISVRK